MKSSKKLRQGLTALGIGICLAIIVISVVLAALNHDRWYYLLVSAGLILLLALQFLIQMLIRRERIANQDMWTLAYTDAVTGGANYTRFKLDVQAMIEKNPHGNFAVFYSDIRNFKYINDVYGFETGNKVLRRYYDLLGAEKKLAHARVNADNFVSFEFCKTDTEQVAAECMRRIGRISDISGIIPSMPNIIVSAGAFCTNGDNFSLTIDAMVDRARIAQKLLKEKHESGCLVYTEALRKEMLEEQAIENRQQAALDTGEFVVYLQPKFDISSHRVAAAEALVRWNDPDKGIIPPGQFIPLFEKNGFIQQLDTYMFEQVCILLRKWLDLGNVVVPVSVNVSKLQLDNPNFQHDYHCIKEKYKIPDGLLEIEFTESMLFDNGERMSEVLEYFRKHGFHTSIDDFGAGYSSLNLLRKLPTDILKLDRLFFSKETYQEREKVIVKNVVAMARELSMHTVAEGVEQWEQVEFLKSVQCEMVQGFVFDKPMPAGQFEEKYLVDQAMERSV